MSIEVEGGHFQIQPSETCHCQQPSIEGNITTAILHKQNNFVEMVNTTITHSNLTGPDSLHYIQEVLDKVYPNPAVFLENLIMVTLSVHVRRLLFNCLKQL